MVRPPGTGRLLPPFLSAVWLSLGCCRHVQATTAAVPVPPPIDIGGDLRRLTSGTDRNGQSLPDGIEVPDVEQASPPSRRDGGAGFIVLELVAPPRSNILCQLQRDVGDGGGPAIVEYFGNCAAILRIADLELDTAYTFWMRYVETIVDLSTGRTFEFEGPLSEPIRFLSADVPTWNEVLPAVETLGVTTLRLWWEEPSSGGSAILGYIIEMETLHLDNFTTEIIYDGSSEWTVQQYIVQDLEIGGRYRFGVYAVNALGRSPPAYVTHSVPRPHADDTFFPLRWDPSELAFGMPAEVTADIAENVTIYARHPVTRVHEPVCRLGTCYRRLFVASLYDACELDVTRTICLPVPQNHPRYFHNRQRLEEPPVCCMQSLLIPQSYELYTFNFTGRKVGPYSLLIHTLFQGGLVGQYWDSIDYQGDPFLVRLDRSLGFDWSEGPIVSLAGDLISARWTGFLMAPETDIVTIHLAADDFARVWFQGSLLIDLWRDDDGAECCGEASVSVDLEEGELYMLQVDYIEIMGNASLELAWTAEFTNFTRMIIPPEYLYYGGLLEDAPFSLVVRPGAASTLTSKLLNPPIEVASGTKNRLWIEALDTAKNTVNDTAVSFQAVFIGPDDYNVTFDSFRLSYEKVWSDWKDTAFVDDKPAPRDHIHFIDFVLQYSGDFILQLFLDSGDGNFEMTYQSPISFQVTPDVLDPHYVVYGAGAEHFTAGVEATFTLELRDPYGTRISPPVDLIEIQDVVWQTYIPPEFAVQDSHFVETYSEWLSRRIRIQADPNGTYQVWYTAYRAGLNHIVVRVNNLVIQGYRQEEADMPSRPASESDLKDLIEIIGHFNPSPDAMLSYILPGSRPLICTTGVICELEMQVRDEFGNRIFEDRSSSLRIRTFSSECTGISAQDSLICLGWDEGECEHIVNGSHRCAFLPTVSGRAILQLLVGDGDALDLVGDLIPEFVTSDDEEQYFNVTAHVRGPWSLRIDIGAVAANTTTMEGPGLAERGNMVGYTYPILVQLQDEFGNNRTTGEPEFNTRWRPLRATLGETDLDIDDNRNGTVTISAYSEVAGALILQVELGYGCIDLRDTVVDFDMEECSHISGSPSELLYWDPGPATALGTTCELEYYMVSGTTHPIICYPRDVFGNRKVNAELHFHARYRLRNSPAAPITSFESTYIASNNTYVLSPVLLTTGTYSVIVEMSRNGGVMAWYHQGLGWNSLIVPNVVEMTERQLEGDDAVVFTRVDPGLGDFEPSGESLEVLGLREFFTVVWQGFLLPNATGNHTFHINTSGNIRMELDGHELYDNLPEVILGNLAPTLVELPGVYLYEGKLTNVTIHYAHGTGPFYVKVSLSRSGPFWPLPYTVPDSQWFFRRTVRYAYAPGSTFPGEPAFAAVSENEVVT